MEDTQMVTIKTLSRMIDTPEKTIRRWVAEGYRGFPVVRLGGGRTVRIPLAEFWAWVKPQSSQVKTDKLEAVL